MNKRLSFLLIMICTGIFQSSCSKSTNNSNNSSSSGNSKIEGFWTYKTDPNNSDNYWNGNVLFKSDGSFRMYTALSFDDTLAADAIADTANEVVTFGLIPFQAKT